jgi:hypothetical protein
MLVFFIGHAKVTNTIFDDVVKYIVIVDCVCVYDFFLKLQSH